MRLISLLIVLAIAPATFGQRFVKVVNNYADLVALNPNDVHTNIFVAGRTAVNDGGQGTFTYYSSSTATTNLGTVFKPTGYSGRFIRQFFGPNDIRWFGAKCDATTLDDAAWTNAISVIGSNGGGDICIPTNGMSLISVSLNVTNNGYRGIGIYGVGRNSGIRMQTANTQIINLGGFGNRISNLTLDYGTAQTSSQTNAVAINLLQAYQSEIDRVYINKAAYGICIPGITVNGSSANWAWNMNIHDVEVANSSIVAISMVAYNSGIPGNHLDNIFIYNQISRGVSTPTAYQSALDIYGWQGGDIQNVNIGDSKFTGGLIQVTACHPIQFRNIHMEDTYIQGENRAWIEHKTSEGTYENLSWSSNFIDTNTVSVRVGLMLEASGAMIVNNFYETGTTTNGISLRRFINFAVASTDRIYYANDSLQNASSATDEFSGGDSLLFKLDQTVIAGAHNGIFPTGAKLASVSGGFLRWTNNAGLVAISIVDPSTQVAFQADATTLTTLGNFNIGFGYFNVSSNGIVTAVNGKRVSVTSTANDTMSIGLSYLLPSTNNATSLGSPTNKWSDVQTVLITSSNYISLGHNVQTGTTYTLASTDNGGVITLNNGSGITVTVPSGLGSDFSCVLIQLGAGQVSLSASGTTINNASSQTKARGQYSVINLYATAANTFILSGDTGP